MYVKQKHEKKGMEANLGSQKGTPGFDHARVTWLIV